MTAADSAISVAMGELGKPYVYGDVGPNAFDCSGLMQFVYAHVGISLPRTAEEQRKFCTKVSSPAPGDLVFWGIPAYHVALYIGNGKIIAAPHTGANVKIEDVWGSPSQYGRVPGAGAALAPVVGVLTAAKSSTSGAAQYVGDLLGGAKSIAIEGLFVVLGVGLVGYGMWRTFSPKIKDQIGDLL